MSIFLLSSRIWQKEGVGTLGIPDSPVPLDLVGYSVFPIKRIPKTAIHKSLTTENLFIVPVALLIFVAVLAKELLKVRPVKVIDSLAFEVF